VFCTLFLPLWPRQLPYKVSLVNRQWELRPASSPRPSSDTTRIAGAAAAAAAAGSRPTVLVVQTDLVVKTRSHKKMAIGPGGATLRLISEAAQADLRQHFGMPVFLTLWVKEASGQQHDTD
jgi:hypothetical protein